MAEEKKGYEVEKEFAKTGDGFSKKVTPEMIAKASLVADLMTIKINDIRPWYETKVMDSADTTEFIMYSQRCRPAQIIVLTHVSALNVTDTPTTTQIAIERGGETLLLNRDVASAAAISVDWDGQVIMTEGDRVKVSFFAVTNGDDVSFAASGYEIKA